MLTVSNISKSFNLDRILQTVSFNLNPGQRLGLVGPNGCGKTTLLKIIAGVDKPDSGHVRFTPSDLRVGYLPQGLSPLPTDTLGSFIARASGDLPTLTAEVERLALAVSESPANAGLQDQYDLALTHLVAASENEGRVHPTLAALGLGHLSFDLPASALSGGQKTRLGLASILLSDPQLLLLDEPTNHLDFDMLDWLEDWLSAFKGGVLIVSHDRAFLDNVADHIVEIDPNTHQARTFTGNYSDYLDQKLAEQEKQWANWRDQETEIKRQQQDIARTKEQSASVEHTTTPRTPGVRRIAKKVARKALAREKKLDRYISAEDRVEKPRPDWQMKLEFGEALSSSRDILMLDDLSVGYGQTPILSNLNAQLRFGARAVLVGPNGCGKTTLLRTVAKLLPPLAGHFRLGPSVRVGYLSQEQEGLDPNLNAFDTIQGRTTWPATEVRTFLHMFLFSGDAVFTPNHLLSYGERTRLSLAALVAQGCNFLLLDEPLNHLDIPSRARFEQALTTFEGTILTVVHDRYFIASFASEIWEIADDQLTITQASD
jgi:ATP-binding cassette, subfamily F, member 3